MFDKQYRFRGRHAVRVDALTSVFDSNSKAKLFDRNVDVYANAPLVGFLYGRTAEQDDTRNPETNQVYNQNVMGDRVIYSQEELQFNFRLIMLLDKDYEPNEDERIDKAFKHMGENPDDEARFDSYVRGGVDVLYEKLIEGVSSPDEYVTRLYDFIEEFETEEKTRLTMFPFGLDPFGNFYCIKENRVVFFDHESNTILPVADTFTEFLGMLYA